jgi:hypothetical protein
MHDIDRTQSMFETEPDASEFELEFEGDEGEYSDEAESGYEGESPFDEATEMELAAELLEITDEQELEQFIGNLVKKARRIARSATGGALRDIVSAAARKALPLIGGAVGTAFGGPAGAMIGSKLTSNAGSLFGLELEGLSPEDQEFEAAKGFVRFAGEAVKEAAKAAPSTPPQAAAKAAVIAAAMKHAPGLLRGRNSSGATMPLRSGRRRSGRWYRSGNNIVLVGI